MSTPSLSSEARAVLAFYAEAGIESIEADEPGGLWNWPKKETAPAKARPVQAAAPVRPAASPAKAPASPAGDAIAAAEAAAAAASSLDELTDIIRAFEGCPLKSGARNTVIHDGVPGADVLVMGEAPSAEDDREGRPFAGVPGQLLDRMLASIDLSRAPKDGQMPVSISQAVYWRPPGGRAPEAKEIAICLPFMRRFIALSAPKLLIMTGNVPTQALFPGTPGISRSRGQFMTLELEGMSIKALPIFGPKMLLKNAHQKRWAWRDLLAAKATLNETLH